MQKTFCDRCGKEIESARCGTMEQAEGFNVNTNIRMADPRPGQTCEFCRNCVLELVCISIGRHLSPPPNKLTEIAVKLAEADWEHCQAAGGDGWRDAAAKRSALRAEYHAERTKAAPSALTPERSNIPEVLDSQPLSVKA